MTTAAYQQLQLLQRTLYERAYAEAHSLVAGSSKTILNYSAKFETSLPVEFDRVTQVDLLEAMRRPRFILYGDFHALKQSQRGLLRAIRAYSQKYKNAPFVLALETFKSRNQDILDSYVRGEITDQELLVKTSYNRDWGFPWPNFKPIIDFAIKNNIPVIGVNSDNGGKDPLATRDRFAASTLFDASAKYPGRTIICLIGEYHLADSHLPRALDREAMRRGLQDQCSVLRILSNVDRYYFQMQSERTHKPTEYLRLKPDVYCIMNSPPWMKWQSYSIWEEMRSSGFGQVDDDPIEIDDSFDENTEESFDIDYQFLALARNLSTFLGFKHSELDLSNFNISYSPDGGFDQFLDDSSWATPRELGRMVERANLDGFYYVSQTNTLLLTSLSINNLAEGAGQHLHRTMSEFNDMQGNLDEAFYRKVYKAMIGMLSAKILNPRRKVNLLQHHKHFLVKTAKRRLLGHASTRRDTSRAVLKHHEWMQQRLDNGGDFRNRPTSIYELDGQIDGEISQAIGYFLGHTIYGRVMANKLPTLKVRDLFRRRIPDLDTVWKAIIDLYGLVDR